MARTPPQAASPRHHQHAARRRVATASGHVSTLAVLACLWPAGNAHAQQRTCEQWSADITAVEGRVEVRRRDNPNWVALTTGERVCTGDALRSQSSSRATITLPDGGTLRLDENSALALPEPPSGLGSLVELLRGVIHVISRDPRFLQFSTPYANAGLEGTEFDIRVDENNRLTEIIVLEGEVAVSTPAGELSVGSDHVALAKDGEAPTASPYAAPIERMRWASYYPPIIDHRAPRCQTKSRPQPSEPTPTSTRPRAAARLATARHRGRRSRHRRRLAYRSRQRDGTVAERPPRPRARRPGRQHASCWREALAAEPQLGRRADGACRTSSKAPSARGGRAHAARGARDRARQRHRR